MNQKLEDVKAVRSLLSSPRAWAKGVMAKTEIGQAVDAIDSSACWVP